MLLHLSKVFLCLFTCTCTQTWNINVTFWNQTFFSDNNRSFRIATNRHLQSLSWYIKSREANLCSTLYARFYSSLSVSSTHRTLECCRRPAPACSWSPADNKFTCVRSSFTVCLCWVLFLSTKYFIKIHLWCKLEMFQKAVLEMPQLKPKMLDWASASTQIYASNWQPHILLTWMQLDRFISTDLAFHSLHGFQSTFLGKFHCRRQIGEIPVKYYLCLKTETTDAVHHQLKAMLLDALGN